MPSWIWSLLDNFASSWAYIFVSVEVSIFLGHTFATIAMAPHHSPQSNVFKKSWTETSQTMSSSFWVDCPRCLVTVMGNWQTHAQWKAHTIGSLFVSSWNSSILGPSLKIKEEFMQSMEKKEKYQSSSKQNVLLGSIEPRFFQSEMLVYFNLFLPPCPWI